MANRFLLYIDILGFSEIVRRKPEVVPALFRALDNSNAHRHGDFRVIQFSDTVLVYNEPVARGARAKSYYVMYLCEFAQEIQYMLLGRDVFIRALITYGAFEDTGGTVNQTYEHIRAFWGSALIHAYQMEKSIQAVGLFVDKTVRRHMRIFKTHPYDAERKLWLADTATALRNIGLEGDDFGPTAEYICATGTEALVAYDLFYLKRLFKHGHDVSLDPSVRIKYLTTWEFYRRKYPHLCAALERERFDFDRVIDIKWRRFMRRIGTPRGYFG